MGHSLHEADKIFCSLDRVASCLHCHRASIKHDEAIGFLKASIEDGCGATGAWSDLAVALRDAGRSTEAEAAYAHAGDGAAGEPLPPLAEQIFNTDRGTHDFKIVDYDYRAEVRYGAGRPAHPELLAQIGAGNDAYRAFLSGMGEVQDRFARIPLCGEKCSQTPS